jgi:2-polyprenyl-3-methyl-5-hydroxy-6-metoxy-1,4-benzoquinol methylase
MTALRRRTFRDPAGYVEFAGEEILRRIHPASAQAAQQFLRSKIAQDWQASGDMISGDVSEASGALLIRHPRIFFPSYPWEWGLSQWRAAAHLTLKLCREAVTEGYLLKDATPLNVLFDGPRPVFVDILSFDPREPNNPIWQAQGQFIRTFLLPLLAHRYLGWPLATSQIYRDGYEPSQLAEALGPLRRLNPKLLWPVTLPAWLDRRQSSAAKPQTTRRPLHRSPEFATEMLQKNLRRLGRQIDNASADAKESRWSQYTSTAAHYSADDHSKKKAFVERILREVQPRSVLDIGANTGTYSILAASSGAKVVALDTDMAAINLLWSRAAKESRDILPLVVNIARPSPALGWENSESISFLDRAEQRFDLVMMLALIHHLLLMDQIPLEQIAALAARLTRRHLLLEWMPQADPMFRQLLRGRDALYSGLTAERMQAAFSPHFSMVSQCGLANERTLFFMERR